MYKQKLLLLTLSAVVAALAGCSRDAAPPASAAKGPGPSPSVIPVPREFNGGKGYFAVSGATRVRYSGGAGAPEAANYFVEQAKANPELGLGGATEGSATSKGVFFEITPNDQSLSDEGYTLKVTEDGAHVAARNPLHRVDQSQQPPPFAVARTPWLRPLGHHPSFSDPNRQSLFRHQSARGETVPRHRSQRILPDVSCFTNDPVALL